VRSKIVVVGAGASVAVAVFRLRALGVTVSSIPDHESAMIAMRLLGPDDVVSAVSSTGRTSSTPTPQAPPGQSVTTGSGAMTAGLGRPPG
jgi:DNA-binding MurR/RpiR family transcriptional regulator